jgi:hypothetical protein
MAKENQSVGTIRFLAALLFALTIERLPFGAFTYEQRVAWTIVYAVITLAIVTVRFPGPRTGRSLKTDDS